MTLVRRRPTLAGLRVWVSDARGRRLAGGPAAGLADWLSRAAPRKARGQVAIALVSDRVIRRLNRGHRGVDRATDVLAFPADAVGPAEPAGRAQGARSRRFLGDVAIATGVAARQAGIHDHSLRTEVRILALHGLLHLLGYDHEADQGAMAHVEERLRRRAKLPAGLTVRAASPGRPRQS